MYYKAIIKQGRKVVFSCNVTSKVIRVLKRILTDSDIIDLYGLYCEFYKNIQ